MTELSCGSRLSFYGVKMASERLQQVKKAVYLFEASHEMQVSK